MTTRIFHFLSFASALAAVGCADGGSPSAPSAAPPPQASAPAQIPLAASSPLRPFLYLRLGECPETNLLYRYLASQRVGINVDEEGRAVLGEMLLAIFESGEFRARYVEIATARMGMGHGNAAPSRKERVIFGRFQSADGTVRFAGLGNAMVANRGGAPVLVLTAVADMIGAGLAAQELIFAPYASTEPPIADMDPCAKGR